MAEIIFALDFNDLNEAVEWIKELKNEISFFKIGLQMFIHYGPAAVEAVKNEGKNVFLDLKLHDIPQTCGSATYSAAQLGCYSLTIHTLSGEEALKEAKKNQINGYPHLWGVTVLSSIKEGDSLKGAEISSRCNLEGVIVSGSDVKKVKDNFTTTLKIVVPGIRPENYLRKDDQKRVLTPSDAVKKGADFLVIGRPIKESKDPVKTVQKIKQEITYGRKSF